ncbi:MAG: glycosyltransferase family 2 protein [Dongiaceae bacterium]
MGGSDGGPVVSVLIPTLARPAQLAALLESLSAQVNAPDFEIVLVDNDAAGSAQAVARRFEGRLPLRYVLEPRPGLASARNRLVAESRGAFLAFVDDDERAAPGWLGAHLEAALAYGADAVFGAKRYAFPATVPGWIRTCRIFRRPQLEAGAELPWWFGDTGNALVRRAALPDRERPFRDAFNETGGEDMDLFRRMASRGARLVAAPAALVEEDRPAARATFGWILRRAFRNGNNQATFALEDGSVRRRTLAAANLGLLLREGARSVLALRRPEAMIDHAISAAEAAGRCGMLVGIAYREYARRPVS